MLRAGARRAVWVFLASLTLASAVAAEVAYDVSVGIGHSDNIRRTEVNEIDENITSVGTRFSVDHRSSHVRADLVGDLAYAEYLDNTFDSEVLGNFTGKARFAFVPQRFEWVFTDNFGQVLSDPFVPATPENRENINYFTTGPDFTVGFGSQTRVRLGARYSLATYEDSPLDSSSLSGELALVRQLSTSNSLSAQARFQQVEYDEAALSADYEQSEAFLRYEGLGARTHVGIEVGYTELDHEASDQQEDGPLVRVDVMRRLSPSTTLTLWAGREFSNSASAFASTQDASGANIGAAPGRQEVQPFMHDFATLGWVWSRQRTELGLSAAWDERSFDQQPLLDQTTMTYSAQLSRELSSRISLMLGGSLVSSDFEQPGDYDETNATVGLRWRLGGHVSMSLRYEYADRDGDLPDASFTENRYWLSFAISRGELRNAPVGPEFAVDQIPQGN